jgi:hypothetical protein
VQVRRASESANQMRFDFSEGAFTVESEDT